MCIHLVSFRRYRTLRLQLSCEIIENGGFWAQFAGGGIPKILDMHFHIALTSNYVAGYG